MMKFSIKSQRWLKTLVILIIVYACIVALSLLYFDIFNGVSGIGARHKEIIALHGLSIVILTGMLVFVAWYQLSCIGESSKSDFLLRLDNRYGSEEIIKARIVIHKLYCKVNNEHQYCREIVEKEISKNICCMELNKDDANDFVYLLNFLDYLETVSYFANNGQVSEKDLKDLLGGSLLFYYRVFEGIIAKRRQDFKSQKYYCELEKVVTKI